MSSSSVLNLTFSHDPAQIFTRGKVSSPLLPPPLPPLTSKAASAVGFDGSLSRQGIVKENQSKAKQPSLC